MVGVSGVWHSPDALVGSLPPPHAVTTRAAAPSNAATAFVALRLIKSCSFRSAGDTRGTGGTVSGGPVEPKRDTSIGDRALAALETDLGRGLDADDSALVDLDEHRAVLDASERPDNLLENRLLGGVGGGGGSVVARDRVLQLHGPHSYRS